MKNLIKKSLCSLMCLLLMISVFPTNIFAGNNQITGFKEIKDSYTYYIGDSLEDVKDKLPSSLEVYLNGSKESSSIDVTWNCVEDFDGDNPLYEYTFIPKWNSSYSLSSSLNDSFDIPYIYVRASESSNKSCKSISTASKTTSSTTSQKSTVYNYSKNTIGLNTAASCGILQNLNSESGIRSNNLENYYNNKLGYSDEDYTSAVNNKKYSQTKFVNDSAGYGLAQWTWYTRKQNLYNRTVKKGISVDNVNAQLGLLKDELSGYTAVWRTLKSVPNTDIGTFLSAATMCKGFENPLDTSGTELVAKTRGINAVKNYWKEYGGSYNTAKSYLGVAGYNYPTNIKKGNGITVNGYVASNYKITKITTKILNSNNKAVYSSSKSPNKYLYSLKNFDDAMAFSKLSNGTYKYYIYAKDSLDKTITIQKTFKVSSSATTQSYTTSTANVGSAFTTTSTNTVVKKETKKIGSTRYPSCLYYGGSYTINGNITSSNKLSNVTISILNTSGKTLQSKSVNPNATSYEINKLDKYLTFGKLAAGTYYFKVSAKDSYSTLTLLNKKFTVSKYSISNARYPKTLKKGAAFTIRGKVSSKFNLKTITVKVINSKNKTVLSKSKTLNNVKSYDVYKLDKIFSFKKLSKGTYTYKIIANDSKVTKTVLSKKFKVK